MSRACTSGRHGDPSLVIAIRLVVQARPDRLFSTMSKRIRGLAPNAVAFRRKVGEKSSSAMADSRARPAPCTGRRTSAATRAGLVDGAVGDAVDAAGGHVDEPRHPGGLRQLGQVHRASVVDVVGDVTDQVADRVVGQLRHVHDGVHALEVREARAGGCPAPASRASAPARVQPAVLVVAGVHPDDVVAGPEQFLRRQAAQVALGTGDQYSQRRSSPSVHCSWIDTRPCPATLHPPTAHQVTCRSSGNLAARYRR